MRPPRPPLQPPAVALEPRAAVKLQPDVDIDLGQQRNLDSATQAAERECRHGRSQLRMPTGGGCNVMVRLPKQLLAST